MIKKTPSATSRDLFRSLLSDLINPKHELALLADKIDWSYFENEFTPHCSFQRSNSQITIKKRVSKGEKITYTYVQELFSGENG